MLREKKKNAKSNEIRIIILLFIEVMNASWIQNILSKQLKGENVEIFDIEKVSGGDINNSIVIRSNVGNYFLKTEGGDDLKAFYEVEAFGLELLRKSSFKVPEVLCCSDDQKPFLLMEYIEEGVGKESSWELFSESLKSLHEVTQDMFGLKQDNYIGTLEQTNSSRASWSEFYIENRLIPQIKLGREKELLDANEVRFLEKLFVKLEELFPKEKPSLLHGDLWSGNTFFNEEGVPVLIDPAAYFGHREMDLGMMKLFGGFPELVFIHYEKQTSLETDWKERIGVTQLYPLLVHLNLFGEMYKNQILGTVKNFV